MLAPNARVGPYEIVSSLGAGGMGEVYRARDRRLNRDVAVKILPDAFAVDDDRVARFTREAQTLAALNHPHIAQIYGIEESAGGRALVMELVEGETLADRLTRGPLPVDEAIALARQVAEALEAAHEAGIVHRDLKPANIRLRPDGSAKVLDFGLAKGVETARVSSASALDSPTFTSPAMTQVGIILGTASYMSPEQAKGKAVDRRADIWAFGCVLFEMLTGRTLFAADTVSETLARVIERAPDLSALPAAIPPAVRALIARTLERDPRMRLRDIGEARITLAHPYDAVASPAAPAPRRHGATIVLLLLAAAAGAALATWATPGGRETTAPPPQRRLVLTSPNGLPPLMTGISPDGSMILTVAGNKLWMQKLDSFDVTEVPASEGARAPFWSADGTSFGFQARGQLWRMARDGGAAVSIGRVPDATSHSGAVWLRDGRLIYASGGGTGLLQIAAAGGEAQRLFPLDPEKEIDIHGLAMLPDGETLIYVLHPASGSWQIETFNLARSSRRTIHTPAEDPIVNQPVYSPTGHVLFEHRAGIWALPFSLGEGKSTGAPFLAVPNARQPSIANDGTLLMVGGALLGGETGLAWLDRSSRLVRTVLQPRDALNNPRLSPDGRFAVATRGTRDAADLWIVDLERGSERRLTFEPGPDVYGTWSADGRFVVYECGRTICARRADGVGARVELIDPPARGPALSSDGKYLVFSRQVSPGDADLFVVNAEGLSSKITATPRVVASGARLQVMPEISPDRRYLAYASSENGMHSVFVTQFPDGQGKWQVPVAGATAYPRWGPRSDRLYIVDEIGDILELPIDRTRLFEIGAPTARITGSTGTVNGYDRSLDGTQFLVPITPGAAPAGRLLVAQHWRPDAR